MKTIEEIFVPLFSGKDISIDITLQDFYDITKKEIHIFTTDVMRFEVVDISYKTHPDWKLIDAVYASSSIPIIFFAAARRKATKMAELVGPMQPAGGPQDL